MICPFCDREVTKRSQTWQGFFCDNCQAYLHTTIAPDPDAIVTEDSPTQPGREVLYCLSFNGEANGKVYQINFFPAQNKTVIYPQPYYGQQKPIKPIAVASPFGTPEKSISIQGQPLNPSNVETRLPTILTFQ